MLDLRLLGLGGDFPSTNDSPAQVLVGDTDEQDNGILVGCSVNTVSNLSKFWLDLNDVDKIFILNLYDSQVGGLQEVALRTLYGGLPKKTLYVPEALVDDLWDRLKHPLSAVAATRHRRVTLDLYFNIVSLSETNAVVYFGDLELMPFRVPSYPGSHLFALMVNNTGGNSAVLAPFGVFDREALSRVYKLVGSAGLVLAGVNDVIPARSTEEALSTLSSKQRLMTVLCGGTRSLEGFRPATVGDRICL